MELLNNRLELLDRLELSGKTCAEIGVQTGDFSVEIDKRCGDLYLIDPFKHFETGYDGDPANVAQEEQDKLFDRVMNRFKKEQNVVVMRETSWDAARLMHLHDTSFDFVYIDANHNFPHVFADLCVWGSNIKPGGWLCGHDYINTSFPGVRQAVDYFCRATGYTVAMGTKEAFGSFAIQVK